MQFLKCAVVLTLLVMACLVSLSVLGFCFYKLSFDADNLYVSLVSTILGVWLGIASTYMRKVTEMVPVRS